MVWALGIDALVEYLAIAARTHNCPRQLLPVLLFHRRSSTHLISLLFYFIVLKLFWHHFLKYSYFSTMFKETKRFYFLFYFSFIPHTLIPDVYLINFR
jgi:hypothetical protein